MLWQKFLQMKCVCIFFSCAWPSPLHEALKFNLSHIQIWIVCSKIKCVLTAFMLDYPVPNLINYVWVCYMQQACKFTGQTQHLVCAFTFQVCKSEFI